MTEATISLMGYRDNISPGMAIRAITGEGKGVDRTGVGIRRCLIGMAGQALDRRAAGNGRLGRGKRRGLSAIIAVAGGAGLQTILHAIDIMLKGNRRPSGEGIGAFT